MARFSFYSPGDSIVKLEGLSSKLKITGVELDESFLGCSSQELLRAHYESDLCYVCIHAGSNLEEYDEEKLQKIAFFCEANNVDTILFKNPGSSFKKAESVLDVLSVFRVNIAFENKFDSFLSTSADLNTFFRKYRNVGLSYNPAEMILHRTHPFFMELISGTYRKNLFMIRVHERRLNGEDVLPINGDCELLELFSSAAGFGRNVWASLAPYSGFTIKQIRPIICNGLLRI